MSESASSPALASFVIDLIPAASIEVSDLVVSGDGVTRVVGIGPTTSREGEGVDLSLLNGEDQSHLGTDLVWRARVAGCPDPDKWADDEWHTDENGQVIGGAPPNFVFVAKSALGAAKGEQ